jgi:uncharacterized protein YdhG (YjbR/CyaY superfamily)
MSDTKKTTKGTATRKTPATGWTDEEREAMKEHARELKAAKRRDATKADGEADVLAKFSEMTDSDRDMAERIHAVVKRVAPDLMPRTWYGMPAYATPDGKVVCFFTPAAKFKERYASFGFNSAANLDEGTMWATSWALTRMTDADEAKIAELVKKAAS